MTTMTEEKPKLKKDQTWVDVLGRYYRRYNYVTGVSLLEPWEKRIVNTSIAATVAVIVFSTGYYAPTYFARLSASFLQH